MRAFWICSSLLMIGVICGFAVGDVVGSCHGNNCLAPWQWWREMKDPDQAAWLQAIATFVAIAVALAGPWIAIWANRAGERARAERAGVQLAIALTPVLGALERRLRSVMGIVSNFVFHDTNPLRWQWVPGMRIKEAELLSSFRGSFLDLGGVGYSLQSLSGSLQFVDQELSSMEALGPAIVAVPQIDERLKHLNQTLVSLLALTESLYRRISKAGDARSLKSLMAAE